MRVDTVYDLTDTPSCEIISEVCRVYDAVKMYRRREVLDFSSSAEGALRNMAGGIIFDFGIAALITEIDRLSEGLSNHADAGNWESAAYDLPKALSSMRDTLMNVSSELQQAAWLAEKNAVTPRWPEMSRCEFLGRVPPSMNNGSHTWRDAWVATNENSYITLIIRYGLEPSQYLSRSLTPEAWAEHFERGGEMTGSRHIVDGETIVFRHSEWLDVLRLAIQKGIVPVPGAEMQVTPGVKV